MLNFYGSLEEKPEGRGFPTDNGMLNSAKFGLNWAEMRLLRHDSSVDGGFGSSFDSISALA